MTFGIGIIVGIIVTCALAFGLSKLKAHGGSI